MRLRRKEVLEMMNNLWWQTIPAARLFLEKITDQISYGNSVSYTIPPDSPWYTEMQERMCELIREKYNGEKAVEKTSAGNPVQYLSSRFAGYRPSYTLGEYVCNHENETNLPDRVIYVTGLDEEGFAQWKKFLAEYRKSETSKNERGKSQFLLETFTSQSDHSLKISSYDVTMLCHLYLAEKKERSELFRHDTMLNYAVELAAGLSGNRPETALALLQSPSALVKDPQAAMKACGIADNMSSGIWKAQLKIFFPCLEQFRIKFVEEHYDQFPDTHKKGDEILTNPYDYEIGDIYNELNKKRFKGCIVNRDDVGLFRDFRNKLAHLTPLSYDELITILKTI